MSRTSKCRSRYRIAKAMNILRATVPSQWVVPSDHGMKQQTFQALVNIGLAVKRRVPSTYGFRDEFQAKHW